MGSPDRTGFGCIGVLLEWFGERCSWQEQYAICSTCCQGIITDVDLSFQRGCGQNIESNGVIYCLHLFSLGYKFTLGPTGWGVKGKVAASWPFSQKRNGSKKIE